MTRGQATLLFGFVLVAAACGAARAVSLTNAPPLQNLSVVWVGRRVLALYPARGRFSAKTYDPVADVWRTEPAGVLPDVALIHRERPALLRAGDVAVVLGSGRAALLDGVTGTWTSIPAPAIDDSTEAVADDEHLMLAHRTACCMSWYGAAFFDRAARRWVDAGPGAPPPRSAPALWVGDSLFVLPGRNAPLFPGKGEDEADHPGAAWRVGSGWRALGQSGAPEAAPAEWAQAIAGAAGRLLVVRVGKRWARYDPATEAWSSASMGGAPIASDRTWTAAGRLLVAGAVDAAVYDPERDSWSPAALPALVGGPVLYRMDDSRLVLVDPQRREAELFDLSAGVTRRRLDARGLPDRRAYDATTWTGRCLILWGSVSYHPSPHSCEGADRPCDPAVDIERGRDGAMWCAKVE
jgi:hypothetical protein